MHRLHGSMMDAAGARPDDLPRAQLRVAKALLPDARHPARAPLPLVPVARTLAAQSLAMHVATNRCTQAFQVTARLPALVLDGAGAEQARALVDAVVHQWMTLQARWIEGFVDLAQEMGESRQANTVSKYVDHEMNLVQQGLALVCAQATATARLVENTQVDVAWWLSRRDAGEPVDPQGGT